MNAVSDLQLPSLPEITLRALANSADLAGKSSAMLAETVGSLTRLFEDSLFSDGKTHLKVLTCSTSTSILAGPSAVTADWA